jgi:hypothetical protein
MGTIPKQYKKEITDALNTAITNGTLKVCLLKASTFIYDSSTHVTYADVAAFECTGTGYVAGGKALSGGTSTYDSTNAVLDATDLAWGTGATISDVGYACIYDTASGNKIRDIKTITPTAAVTSGTLTLQWSASGIIKVSSV